VTGADLSTITLQLTEKTAYKASLTQRLSSKAWMTGFSL
jgi:hypothetical protein